MGGIFTLTEGYKTAVKLFYSLLSGQASALLCAGFAKVSVSLGTRLCEAASHGAVISLETPRAGCADVTVPLECDGQQVWPITFQILPPLKKKQTPVVDCINQNNLEKCLF